MNRWYSSDLHLGHLNIIKYSNRPFSSTVEMDEFIIARHNELIKPEDHWTCLGDLTMSRGGKVQQDAFIRLIKRLNGHKRLFLGNHDHFPIKTYLEAGFEKIYATWRDEQGLLFSHIPIHPSCIGSARANIHGHIHTNASPPPATFTDKDGKIWIKPYINLCVEKTGYMPVHYDELNKLVEEAKTKWSQMHTTPKRESI